MSGILRDDQTIQQHITMDQMEKAIVVYKKLMGKSIASSIMVAFW